LIIYVIAMSILVVTFPVFGACRTPLGVSCHTITYKGDQAVYFNRGVTDFGFFHTEATHSVRADGSVYGSVTMTGSSLKYGSATGTPQIGIYDAKTDKVIRVFTKDKTFSSRDPIIWHDRPFRKSADGDSLCQTGIRHQGNDFANVGFETVLGLRTVHWHRDLGNGGYEDSWLAPDLDCTLLRRDTVRRNALHIPSFTDHMEAVNIDWREPDQALFAIPAGFRQVEDPALPGLKRFVERNSKR